MDYEVSASENEGYLGSGTLPGDFLPIFKFRNQSSLAIRAYTANQ
jgi:hypothetical protein